MIPRNEFIIVIMDLNKYRVKCEGNDDFEFDKWFWSLKRPEKRRMLIDAFVLSPINNEVSLIFYFEVEPISF